MPVFLDQIVAASRQEVARAKIAADYEELEKRAERHIPRGFEGALRARSKFGIAVIAELKRASPSKGLIRENFVVEDLARDLESAGAAALSVLTNEEFFQGSLENLRRASAQVSLPCLRKDFIVDEFQLLQARANSADAVLLIVSALSNAELTSLASAARSLRLDVLCEVHNHEEFRRALDAGCDLVGVNTRDLRTFEVNPAIAYELASHFPSRVLPVAESGIRNGEDIALLREAGYRAFLVGETLMRAPRPGEALRELTTPGVRA